MKYFTLAELLESQAARRKNITEQFNPPGEVVLALNNLVDNILDPLRESYGKPIRISSGYRCKRVNAAVGGASTSQHLLGQAADIQAADGLNMPLFEFIKEMNLPFDQLLWEYGTKTNPAWVHVSFGPRNRKQILYIGVK
jgi:uncharacterized protein YcbK (DUF882 family)